MKAATKKDTKYLIIRVDPALHATIKMAAITRGESVQTLVAGILDERFREAEPGQIMARLRELDRAAAHGARRRARQQKRVRS